MYAQWKIWFQLCTNKRKALILKPFDSEKGNYNSFHPDNLSMSVVVQYGITVQQNILRVGKRAWVKWSVCILPERRAYT